MKIDVEIDSIFFFLFVLFEQNKASLMTISFLLLGLSILIETTHSLRCSTNTSSPYHCRLTTHSCEPPAPRSPCTTTGSFRDADFAGAESLCRKMNMSLVTPVDMATLRRMVSLCSTTFVGARRNVPTDCRYRDVDDDTDNFLSTVDLMDLDWWTPMEPSTPLEVPCNPARLS
jgi:hypothetical protein